MLTLYRRHAPHAMSQPLEPGSTEPEPAPGVDSPLMPEQPTEPEPEPDGAPQRA